MNRNNLYNIVCETLPILIFLYLGYLVMSQATNIPTWDQWAELFILEKYYENRLTIGDFFESYAGHILVFPRLIWLPLGLMTQWDVRYELPINLFIGLCIYLFYRFVIFRKLGLDQKYNLLVFSAIAVFVFSLTQFQNWMWGWQLQIFLCSLFAIISLALLTLYDPGLRTTALAAAAAIIATFSFAAGINVWFVGFVVLLIRCRRLACIIPWIILATACISIDIIQSRASTLPNSLFRSDNFLDYIGFVCVYIGAPVGTAVYDATVALYNGIAALLLAVTLCLTFAYSENRKHPAVLCFSAIIAFSILVAVLVSITRDVNFGTAAPSRFMSFSIHFWISLIGLIFFYIKTYSGQKVKKYFLITSVVIMVSVSIYTSMLFEKFFYTFEERSGQIAFLKVHSNNEAGFPLNSILWDDAYLFELLGRAKKYNLSLYAEAE